MRRLPFLLIAVLAATPIFADPSTREFRGPGRHMILQASGPLTPEDRAELAAQGIVVRHVLRGNEYLARVADGVVAADARVQALQPIAAEDKIDRSAWREAARGLPYAEVNVLFHEDVPFDDARSALMSAGGALADPLSLYYGPLNRITARIAPSMLTALASDERVFAVLGPIRFKVETDNARSAAASHVPEVYAAPYNLSGAGVTVSLFELGSAQANHVEFGDRFTVFATGGAGSDNMHATHVAGTIGAAGLRPDAKGMAPAAKIYQFCVRTGSNTCTNDWLVDKDQKLAPLGITVDNNSWGYVLGWTFEDYPVWNDFDEYWGAYDLTLAAPIDEISIDKQVLFVHSAGNDAIGPSFPEFAPHRHVDDDLDTITDKLFCYSMNGSGSDCPTSCTGGCETVRHHPQNPFDTVGVTAAGKNSITVGAVSVLGTPPNESKVIASFSSRGPAKDGRVKPDVVARGTGVLSTVPTNAYASLQGTSMASPAVAGIAALMTEQWKKTFGSGPTPAQLKAVLIAGAEDIGNPGPDYTYGFGMVNAKSSADLIIADANQGKAIRNLTVSQGQSFEIPVTATAGQKMRVLLSWADPAIPYLPGRPDIAAKALVNDLDVKIITPTGATVLPYVLNKDDFNANATTGVNTIDNTEVVEIANAAGVYRVVVTGTSVTEGPQQAVLISNAIAGAVCKDLTEGNDTEAGAYGNLVPNQSVGAAICTAGDVDFFKFFQATAGTITVNITTGDTPLRFTLSGAATQVLDVAANSTAMLTATGGVGTVTVKVEATAAPGLNPTYTFTPQFQQPSGPRRRGVRH